MEKFNIEQEIQKLALHCSIFTLQLCHNLLIYPFDLISKEKYPTRFAECQLLTIC